jgi:hypothetical protein
MAPSRDQITTPLTTATGTLKRTVSDQLRRLNPVMSPLLALVKGADVDKMGKLSYGGGMIEKEATDTMKFEWFTETPIDIYATITTAGTDTTVGLEVGTAIVADTSAFRTRDIITNLSTLEVAIVNTITSATTLTLTCVTATWTTAVGDVIAMSCRTMEEGTSDITPLTKEADNNYNFVFPFRYVISIADTAINSPHYTEQPLQRYMIGNTMFTMRNLENAFFLGQRAATNNTTTVTIGGTAYSLYTTRGIMNYASNPIDAGGTMTFDKWCTTVFEGLPDTLDPSQLLKMFCSKRVLGRMINWANQKLIYMESGEKDEFGVLPIKFRVGNYTIEPIAHNLFGQGALASTTVIIDPSDLKYRFKKGMDITTVNDLQLPATWGTVRGIQGVVGLQCWSGGSNVKLITNWNN